MMRTTVTIDDQVAARLKEYGRRRGLSFKETINELLRQGLDAPRAMRAPTAFSVQARPLSQRPGVELDNIADVLERLDEPGHR
jgi:hypothetical protein